MPETITPKFPEKEAVQNPFEGIDFFRELDERNVRIVEEGRRGEEGWLRAEYYPKAALCRIYKLEGSKLKRCKFDLRNNSFEAQSGSYQPDTPDLAIVKEGFSLLERESIEFDLGRTYREVNTILAEKQKAGDTTIEPLGFHEVDSMLLEMTAQENKVEVDQLEKGKLYLCKISPRRRVDAYIFRFGGINSEGGYRILTAEADDQLFREENVVIALKKNHRPRFDVQPCYAFNEQYQEIRPIPANVINAVNVKEIYTISEEQIKEVASFITPPEDPFVESDEGDRERFCMRLALEALQARRWGKEMAEQRAEKERIPYVKIWELPSPRADDVFVSKERYKEAFKAMIQRFGKERFAEAAKQILQRHLNSLHAYLLYGPHSDIDPLYDYQCKIASQVINRTHPLDTDMTEYGAVANAKTLCGDADFWAIMREEYPELFNDFISYLKILPECKIQSEKILSWLIRQDDSVRQPLREQRSKDDDYILTPVEVLQYMFKDAYDVIKDVV